MTSLPALLDAVGQRPAPAPASRARGGERARQIGASAVSCSGLLVGHLVQDGGDELAGARLLRPGRAPPAAAPTSTIAPRSMKTTRSATSRAKPSSWVTTIMVMPDAGEVAHDGEHLADEFGIERRGRLVEEHQLRPHGEGAGDRDALLLAAGELRSDRHRACRRGRPARAARAPRRVASRRGALLHA